MLLLALLVAIGSIQSGSAWDPSTAEHLLNRAAFGAGSARIARALEAGREATVDELLRPGPAIEEPYYPRKRLDGATYERIEGMKGEAQAEALDRLHNEDRAQSLDFLGWWIQRVLDEREPVRERMVLFWHGHLTSSLGIVKSSYDMIQQNQLFRRLALGSVRDLLHAIVRDPAMLLYLDNASNTKSAPNENFARELLELFTLGEGNYGEADVAEVARAFAGWGQSDGRFHMNSARVDEGVKHVLGVEVHDGDDVVDVLLAQPACARHLARKLLLCFEGQEPAPERLERYAARLREDWQIGAFLRALFLDPEFYRADMRGARIASPFDFLVGTAHRLGITPDARLVFATSALLGQRLFFPPTVLGWPAGEQWATSESLVLRGGMAGLFLGRTSTLEILGLEQPARARPSMEAMSGGEEPAMRTSLSMDVVAETRILQGIEWRPRLNLTQRFARAGMRNDDELARALLEELLPIPAPVGLVEAIAARLTGAREAGGIGSDPWTDHPHDCEPLLRELAHVALSLPEAQVD